MVEKDFKINRTDSASHEGRTKAAGRPGGTLSKSTICKRAGLKAYFGRRECISCSGKRCAIVVIGILTGVRKRTSR